MGRGRAEGGRWRDGREVVRRQCLVLEPRRANSKREAATRPTAGERDELEGKRRTLSRRRAASIRIGRRWLRAR